MAMGLDGTLGAANARAVCLLVLAANDEFEDLPLAGVNVSIRERNMSSLFFEPTRRFMMRKGLRDCGK